ARVPLGAFGRRSGPQRLPSCRRTAYREDRNVDDAAARERFAELRGNTGISPTELDEVWAALEPLDAAELVGEWTGDEFGTGHLMNGQLAKGRWYGKIMRSVDDVVPIVCRGEDGELF